MMHRLPLRLAEFETTLALLLRNRDNHRTLDLVTTSKANCGEHLYLYNGKTQNCLPLLHV